MPMTPFIGVRISWLMLATNSDFRREASSASCRARTSSSMFCTTSTTPPIAPWASRQGCTVQRRNAWLPSSRSITSSGSVTTSPASARRNTSLVALGHAGPGLGERAADERGVVDREVAQPAGAVGDVAAFPVQHRHRHRRVRDDLTELLPLALDRLLQQLALRDVASQRLEPREAAVLDHELGALPHPDVAPVPRPHRELAVRVRHPLRALVLVEAPGLLAVVLPHEVEERPAAQLRLAVAEHLGDGGVDVDEAAVRVRAEDDVVGRLDDPAEALLRAAGDRRPGALALEIRRVLPQLAQRRRETARELDRAAEQDGGAGQGDDQQCHGRGSNRGTVRPRRGTVKAGHEAGSRDRAD